MVFRIQYKKGRKSESPAFHTVYRIQNTKYCARALRACGMTLIETVVGIAVLIIVFLALTSSLLYFYRTNRYAIEQSSAVTSAQRGIDKAIRTIREASYSSEGAFPIVSISANDFVFYADVDSDPLIEKIHYYISGTSLMQGAVDATGDPPAYTGAEVASMISDYVHNIDQGIPMFHYFDANGTAITDYQNQWANVRFVKASIVVNVDPNKLPNQMTLSSSAALRNLK
ncbi:MAG: type II secretion system protein [bacterium]|nr:type II secretion system protein [bacterium]